MYEQLQLQLRTKFCAFIRPERSKCRQLKKKSGALSPGARDSPNDEADQNKSVAFSCTQICIISFKILWGVGDGLENWELGRPIIPVNDSFNQDWFAFIIRCIILDLNITISLYMLTCQLIPKGI